MPYRDELAALRARLQTMDARLRAERLRREAAEARMTALRMAFEEARHASPEAAGEAWDRRRGRAIWPSMIVACLATTVCFYVAARWARQTKRSTRIITTELHRAEPRVGASASLNATLDQELHDPLSDQLSRCRWWMPSNLAGGMSLVSSGADQLDRARLQLDPPGSNDLIDERRFAHCVERLVVAPTISTGWPISPCPLAVAPLD